MADFFAKGKNPINGYGGVDEGYKVKQVISLSNAVSGQGYVTVDVSSYGIDSTKSYAWIAGKTGNYVCYVASLTNTQLRFRSEGAQTVYLMILELA